MTDINCQADDDTDSANSSRYAASSSSDSEGDHIEGIEGNHFDSGDDQEQGAEIEIEGDFECVLRFNVFASLRWLTEVTGIVV